MELDKDWPAVLHNLWWARNKWARLSRVLSREGADARTSGRIFVAVVQTVLLYRSETWEMTPHIGKVLVRFHHRVAGRLTVQQPQRWRDGGWVYPPLAEEMEEALLQEVETYASHHQNIVAQLITTRPIMDLCLAAEKRIGSWVTKLW